MNEGRKFTGKGFFVSGHKKKKGQRVKENESDSRVHSIETSLHHSLVSLSALSDQSDRATGVTRVPYP